MFVRITRENALKDLQICKTEIVEIIDTGAVRQNLVTLCFVFSYKGKKETPKMPSIKKKIIAERAIHIEPKQSKQKSKKYLTIYSINLGLYYSTKNIVDTSKQFKQIHGANFFILKLYLA